MGFELNNKNGDKLDRFTQKSSNAAKKSTVSCSICDKGDKFMLKNRYKEAAHEYLTSILVKGTNSTPDAIRPHKAVSKAYRNLKAYDKAIKHLEKAKEFCSFDHEIYYELGLNHLLSAHPDIAIKNFQRTIKLDKTNVNAQIQLAISHEMSGEETMALMIYQKIIEENPELILAYNHKAGLYMQLEMFLDAAELFRQILKINPNYYRANLGLGICFDKLEKYPVAVRYYKKYISAKPQSETAYALVNRVCEIYQTKQTLTERNLKVV